ncbi:hypothetical protein M441DRAFT_403403 [Trichoderma asperellum CBS 433.97]|uniref:Secreted protein n=1 Tax=Trichoderma asperellum (strain ATCC 204424 / CBS 433.97 / NBRC 101777) TaxID=1042311 RepID=A0A2T3ZA85_TRIA4|nr:hypothetical protein M441DRAFT_403403 [Trichoderma asperellum CBS 433.97]PTB41717.1 hypothetical protein M441DRAFT_403403 [Trichoderma asperellum CBS 433.97]
MHRILTNVLILPLASSSSVLNPLPDGSLCSSDYKLTGNMCSIYASTAQCALTCYVNKYPFCEPFPVSQRLNTDTRHYRRVICLSPSLQCNI